MFKNNSKISPNELSKDYSNLPEFFAYKEHKNDEKINEEMFKKYERRIRWIHSAAQTVIIFSFQSKLNYL